MLVQKLAAYEFLSTPSARRATCRCSLVVVGELISIHALREEGDYLLDLLSRMTNEFLSTPSARRATRGPADWGRLVSISIHALREEGDRLPVVRRSG